MDKLKNKVALITGASKGIGAAIAQYYANEGAKVIVNYNRDNAGADKVVKNIIGSGGIALSMQADVSNEVHVIRLLNEIRQAFGKLDILVNNAGIYLYEPIEQITVES